MSGDGEMTLDKAIRLLGCEEREELSVSVPAHLPERSQTVTLRTHPPSGMVAETTIHRERSEGIRQRIFEWNDRYPMVAFRATETGVVARLDIRTGVDIEQQAALARHLARLADRLEYEVGEGRDEH